jgi:hypothetical protein
MVGVLEKKMVVLDSWLVVQMVVELVALMVVM